MMQEMLPTHCTQKGVNFNSFFRTNFGPAFPTLWPHVLACWSAAAGWSAAAAWCSAAAAGWLLLLGGLLLLLLLFPK